LTFKVNSDDNKLKEIFMQVVTKPDKESEVTNEFIFQTITIDSDSGKYKIETKIVLYDCVTGSLSLVDEDEKQNCIAIDFIKALDLHI